MFNEVVGLHVHNQQEYKLVVDHEFLEWLGWQWYLHGMVLHIGSTREEGHFVVYVASNDKWWLCDDTTVKVMTPPPTHERRLFWYTIANKQIWLYQTCGSLPPNGQDLQPLVRHRMPRAYLLTPRCQSWCWHQVRPLPPPSTQGASRVGYRNGPMHAQSVSMDSSVPAMALARGAPPPFPNCNAECIQGRGPEDEYACPQHA